MKNVFAWKPSAIVSQLKLAQAYHALRLCRYTSILRSWRRPLESFNLSDRSFIKALMLSGCFLHFMHSLSIQNHLPHCRWKVIESIRPRSQRGMNETFTIYYCVLPNAPRCRWLCGNHLELNTLVAKHVVHFKCLVWISHKIRPDIIVERVELICTRHCVFKCCYVNSPQVLTVIPPGKYLCRQYDDS